MCNDNYSEFQIKGNIHNQAETDMIISKILNNLTEILSRTLGPFGQTTIIEGNSIDGHIITKDGYTVLKNISYMNPIANTILDFVKTISKSLVDEVGDGSTTSIVTASKMYDEIKNIKNLNLSPRELLMILNKLKEIISEILKRESIKIDDSNFSVIKDIASISNNNDNETGESIYQLYKHVGKNGFITLETSKDNQKDQYEFTEGIEFDYGLLDSLFTTNKAKTEFEGKEVSYLLVNDMLEESDLESLCNLYGRFVSSSIEKPFVVIAKSFSPQVFDFFKINKYKNRNLNVCLIHHPFANANNYEEFDDLAVFLGADIYDKRNGMSPDKLSLEMLGKSESILVKERNTKIIKGYGKKEDIQDRLKEIESKLDKIENTDKRDTSEEVFKLKQRLAKLNCKIVKLFVGGSTEVEKNTRKYLLEDSIYACESALKYGYISGGNLSVCRIIYKNLNEIVDKLKSTNIYKSFKTNEEELEVLSTIVKIIYESFRSSYLHLLYNKFNDIDICEDIIEKCVKEDLLFNLVNHEYESIKETKIVNSVMTDIEILNATISIMGLITTSNQFITKLSNVVI